MSEELLVMQSHLVWLKQNDGSKEEIEEFENIVRLMQANG
jgi:hypothetical protein